MRPALTTTKDLKPNNLLIASTGELKIADFGLAREFGDAKTRMTSQVITRLVFRALCFKLTTRWYRPPELLWGARYYSPAVDMWSIGTIVVELVLRVPFLAGDSDIDQLKKTFHAMGSPTEQDWPVSCCLGIHMDPCPNASTGPHKASRLPRGCRIPSEPVVEPRQSAGQGRSEPVSRTAQV
jgi:serine/threonine protein kinase